MLLRPNAGRALSAAGGLLVLGGLFLTWYHVHRSFNAHTTGWQTFPNLRVVLLAGAVVLVASALVAQTRPLLVVRALVGLALAALILRRILFPPELAYAVTAQAGVYVGLAGALAAAAGGLVDSGRALARAYPGVGAPLARQLGPGRRGLPRGDQASRR